MLLIDADTSAPLVILNASPRTPTDWVKSDYIYFSVILAIKSSNFIVNIAHRYRLCSSKQTVEERLGASHEARLAV